MKAARKPNILLGYLTVLIGNLAINSPSLALPGQQVTQVKQWSMNHPLIDKLLLQTKYDDGYADYSSQGETDSATFTFNIWLDKANNVKSENIDYRPKVNHPDPLSFDRTNHNALLFLEQMYGKVLVEDFKNSKYVRKVKDNASWENYFYLGKKFAFQCMNNSSERIYHITLIKKEDLEKHIHQMIVYSHDKYSGY